MRFNPFFNTYILIKVIPKWIKEGPRDITSLFSKELIVNCSGAIGYPSVSYQLFKLSDDRKFFVIQADNS